MLRVELGPKESQEGACILARCRTAGGCGGGLRCAAARGLLSLPASPGHAAGPPPQLAHRTSRCRSSFPTLISISRRGGRETDCGCGATIVRACEATPRGYGADPGATARGSSGSGRWCSRGRGWGGSAGAAGEGQQGRAAAGGGGGGGAGAASSSTQAAGRRPAERRGAGGRLCRRPPAAGGEWGERGARRRRGGARACCDAAAATYTCHHPRP